MNIKDMIEKNLLNKVAPDTEKANQSIKVARSKLGEARRLLEAGSYEPSIVFSYMSMFHAARGLMYKEGYVEKSHFAIVIFLEELYENRLGKHMISRFNTLRMQRHEGLYGLETDFSKEDAEHAVKDGEDFLDAVCAEVSTTETG